MNKILNFFRDPIWQALGVILGALALFYTITNEGPINSQLAIIKSQSISFDSYLLPNDLIKLNIDKSIKDSENAVVDYYYVVNKGEKTITPDDFVEPLTISSNLDIKIYRVDSCNHKKRNERLRESSELCEPAPLSGLGWTKKEGGWVAEPSLLNPNEFMCVIVIKELKDQKDSGTIIWNARIKGTKLSIYESAEEYYKSGNLKFRDYFRTYVLLEDLEPYWFVLLQVSAFYGTLLLARQAKWNNYPVNNSIWPIIIIMLLSTATAEIVISIYKIGVSTQSYIIWPLLVGHIGLIIYFVIRAMKNRI